MTEQDMGRLKTKVKCVYICGPCKEFQWQSNYLVHAA